MTALSQLYMSDPYRILTIIYLFTSFHFICNKVGNPRVANRNAFVTSAICNLLELLSAWFVWYCNRIENSHFLYYTFIYSWGDCWSRSQSQVSVESLVKTICFMIYRPGIIKSLSKLLWSPSGAGVNPISRLSSSLSVNSILLLISSCKMWTL